eukprot:scaffold8436_cov146-Ochromonas_danica.AAC.1
MTVDEEEFKDMTALRMAAVKGNAEMTRLLLLHPAIDVNAVDSKWGCTPLHTVCSYGHVEVVLALLSCKRVDANKVDKSGCIPLHIACCRGHVDVVKILLLDPRVDVTEASKDGRTPFLLASSNGHADVVKILLLDERVDVNKSDN